MYVSYSCIDKYIIKTKKIIQKREFLLKIKYQKLMLLFILIRLPIKLHL